MNNITVFKTLMALIGAYIGIFLGQVDGLIVTLIVFVVTDYVTGVACGIAEHKLSSEIGFKGIFRKVLIFVLVGIANLLDVHVLNQGSIIRTATIFFYLANEGISILENAGRLGLPISHKLKAVLQQLKAKDEEDTTCQNSRQVESRDNSSQAEGDDKDDN